MSSDDDLQCFSWKNAVVDRFFRISRAIVAELTSTIGGNLSAQKRQTLKNWLFSVDFCWPVYALCWIKFEWKLQAEQSRGSLENNCAFSHTNGTCAFRMARQFESTRKNTRNSLLTESIGKVEEKEILLYSRTQGERACHDLMSERRVTNDRSKEFIEQTKRQDTASIEYHIGKHLGCDWKIFTKLVWMGGKDAEQ